MQSYTMSAIPQDMSHEEFDRQAVAEALARRSRGDGGPCIPSDRVHQFLKGLQQKFIARGAADEATIWPGRGPNGRRDVSSERILNALLEDDPERNGRRLPEGLHHLVVSPLIAVYEIDSAHRIVRVAAVSHYPL